jgi:flavin reductase (DIM6/NTAB) family NADH-FMN oxidoreductase RutF
MQELTLNRAVALASPYPYVLGVTIDAQGRPNIIGLSWWSFVSLDPRMLMISVGHTRYSRECLEHHDEFTLCFPTDKQARSAWLCGTVSGRDVDKFKETGFVPMPAKHVSPPLITGCAVAFECRVSSRAEVGDHTVYFADVLACWGTPEQEHHLFTASRRKLFSLNLRGEVEGISDFKP